MVVCTVPQSCVGSSGRPFCSRSSDSGAALMKHTSAVQQWWCSAHRQRWQQSAGDEVSIGVAAAYLLPWPCLESIGDCCSHWFTWTALYTFELLFGHPFVLQPFNLMCSCCCCCCCCSTWPLLLLPQLALFLYVNYERDCFEDSLQLFDLNIFYFERKKRNTDGNRRLQLFLACYNNNYYYDDYNNNYFYYWRLLQACSFISVFS